MKTVVAIRHVAFEDLGSFEAVLLGHGYSVTYVDAVVDGFDRISPLDPDLLMVLGGPVGVYDEADYPFLARELGLLEQRLAAGRPTLGICLGCQLMARALGARVYSGSGKEIGWRPLTLTEAGARSPLRHLAAEHMEVLHWHGDTFDLPEGATRLASTEQYENQAFSWGEAALGLQFHPEVTAGGLERWFVGHASEIAVTPAVSVAQLRADTQRCSETLERQGPRCFEEWLQTLVS